MICEICGEWNHFYNVNVMLSAQCIAYQFTDYWLDGHVPTMTETRLIVESCYLIFNDEEFENFCTLLKSIEDDFKQDQNDGYKLFKLSEATFKDGGGKNWDRLIVVFAFATKLMNRENSDLISKWLMHVLLQKIRVWM